MSIAGLAPPSFSLSCLLAHSSPQTHTNHTNHRPCPRRSPGVRWKNERSTSLLLRRRNQRSGEKVLAVAPARLCFHQRSLLFAFFFPSPMRGYAGIFCFLPSSVTVLIVRKNRFGRLMIGLRNPGRGSQAAFEFAERKTLRRPSAAAAAPGPPTSPLPPLLFFLQPQRLIPPLSLSLSPPPPPKTTKNAAAPPPSSPAPPPSSSTSTARARL